MRLLYLFSLLLCFTCGENAIGQATIGSIDDMHILYVGLPNPITVVAEKVPMKEVIVTTDNGSVEGGEGHYTIVPAQRGMRTTVTVSAKTTGGTKELNRSYYRAVCPTGTICYLLGKTGGELHASDVHQAIAPIARLPNWGYCGKFPITGFITTVIRNGKEIFRKQINAPGVSLGFSDDGETLHMIQTLRPGDRLKLSNILYIGLSKDCSGYLPPLSFNIIE